MDRIRHVLASGQEDRIADPLLGAVDVPDTKVSDAFDNASSAASRRSRLLRARPRSSVLSEARTCGARSSRWAIVTGTRRL
ncbi:hypothetical protein NKJ42_00335 [Mesorhizobium sp. M0129]